MYRALEGLKVSCRRGGLLLELLGGGPRVCKIVEAGTKPDVGKRGGVGGESFIMK
jgi:hypothetical protein